MFYFTSKAIDDVCDSSRDFIYSDSAFIRKRKWGFEDYMVHITFNKRKTLQNNIDTHLKNSTSDVDAYKKQSFSEQRVNINPMAFKQINLNYLNNIGYFDLKKNNPFFKTFLDFRLYAGDGSLFTLFNKKLTLKEFGFPEDYGRLPKVSFCGITDVLNDFLIDGVMGERGIGEMTLIHQNIQNIENLIEPTKSIFTFDRGFVSLELICRLISINTYFVIRLKNNSYIDERYRIKSDDSPISIPLTENRLKIFKDHKLKQEFQDVEKLNLRIVTIELEKENNETDETKTEKETLLTNLPSEIMSKEDIAEIYNARWGIECTYKTLKQRLQIENYTAHSKTGILQDIYSTFLTYNIFCYTRIYFNTIINRTMRKKGKTSQYDVNQSNLITRIKEDMFEIILNPTREKVRKFTKDFIKKCIHSPNKIKESKKYKRKKKQFKPKFTANYKLNF
ncbi:MAG: IS4 family transposase [Methanobrevibacter sp.]|nr:IS4 family transposase [Methanobrevibacter sp.]